MNLESIETVKARLEEIRFFRHLCKDNEKAMAVIYDRENKLCKLLDALTEAIRT